MGDVVLLVTNGGPHPPDKWASVAAARIGDLIQIDEVSDSDASAVARKAKPRFIIAVSDAVEPIIANVMAAEHSGVENGSIKARTDEFSLSAFISEATNSVSSLAALTPFSAHFALADVQSTIRNIFQQNFIDAANIQRSWEFDAKGL